ncbi:MAG: glycosyltransferase family 4 protein [Chitinophagaceae bacterium]|nr:glycosyltransferase family 4 protein [Chitinophagaceae bacterium]
MKILFLTQYFPPETGAPQNRIHSLATYLADLGAEVTVLTAMPNYPKMEIQDAYKGRYFVKEHDGKLSIYRSWIFVKKSKGIVARLLNYFSFVFSSLFTGLFRIQKHEVIICESPPLFLGISAWFLAKIKGSKMIFNVSDLWPESAEKLDIIHNKFLLGISYKLEAFLYKQSTLVVGQTQGIVANIQERFKQVPTYWLPNGIDFHAFNIGANGSLFRQKHGYVDHDFVLLYAGVLGHAQGLEVILEAAAKTASQASIKYLIVGDGPEYEKLTTKAKQDNLQFVTFLGNIPRNEMPEAVAACDAYIVPLKKNDLFLGAVPSKLFEPLAMGKPILLGVDGEARELFIERGKAGLFNEPENSEALAANIMQLFQDTALAKKFGESGKAYVQQHFDRKVIAHGFFTKLKSLFENSL